MAIAFAHGAGAKRFGTGEFNGADTLLTQLEAWGASAEQVWLNERLLDNKQMQFRTRVSWIEFLAMLKAQAAQEREENQD